VLDFKERIQAYLKVHNDAESKVPKLKETNDPAKVHDREAALGAMIRRMRTSAREGEVFGTSFREVLAREVRQDFLERSAADRKALMIEVPTRTRIAVNTTYPTQLPLATFPPRLLQRLPDLPPELEYRIVGKNLILRDTGADLIVDFVPNETICTEACHKYLPDQIATLARTSGFRLDAQWMDMEWPFAENLLTAV